MKGMKKLGMSILLAMVMMLGLMPVNAFAQTDGEEGADSMSTCDFNVTSNDATYSWDETSGVLTITGGTVTVSNKDRDTATSQRIYIQGVATVILDGVNISTGAGAPIEIRDYSDTTVTLTLSGSNTLISNTAKKAAIHKTRGQQADSSQAANLIINGSGSLKVVGGPDAAAIGGGGSRGDVHNITINGGNIDAAGTWNAAGIGASEGGSTWNIVINDGNIRANGKPGIGANSYGGSGNADIKGGMVVANSCSGSTPTGGLVSTDGGKNYTVYSNYSLSQNLNIANDGTLTVKNGATLTLTEGTTLTNEGILVNDGTISGTVVNEGTIYNKGGLPSDISGTGKKYEQYVTVNGGSGTGIYAEGVTVQIKAAEPESGKLFAGWSVELGSVELADQSQSKTTFTMPAGCVTVTANYADIVASITGADDKVTYYSERDKAMDAWQSSGGTLTIYNDNFNLDRGSIPQNSVLNLNGHSISAGDLYLQNSLTIKNGTIRLLFNASIAENAVITFENVTVKNDWEWHTVEITNNGTIIDKGLTLDGVTVSGKTALTNSTVSLTGIPDGGFAYGEASDVGVAYNGTLLIKDTDYSVSLSRSDGKSGSGFWDAGTITMKITGKGGYIGTVTKTYEINKKDPEIGEVSADVVYNTLDISAIVLNRYNEDVEGALTVDTEQKLGLGKNEITYTFVPASSNYKTVTGKVVVTVKDTLPPTGKVTMAENTWTGFGDKITFERFFKEAQTVFVTAEDNLSGVYTIEYIESGTALSLDEVKAASRWTKLEDNSICITPDDGRRFIVYIRITDEAGNKTYLSTDGAIYDTSAPVIAGADDGKTYYDAMTLTITDSYLDKVSLNGEIVTLEYGKLTLQPAEGAQTIVATDKAGNSTTLTVTVNRKDDPAGKRPPVIIKGDNAKLTQGTKASLSFTSDAEFADFLRVEVDGKEVDKSNYTVASGSTIVTLSADYVATLSVGEHTLGIVSQNGTATAKFTVTTETSNSPNTTNTSIVNDSAKSPQTGDSSKLALWLTFLLLSGGAVSIMVIGKKEDIKS